MIKHIVMWNVRGETEVERQRAAQTIKTSFEGLKGQVPGLIEIEVGIDQSHVDYACDVVLYTVFSSAEDLRGYASHPAHLAVREALGDMRIARYQVDYSIV